MNAFTSLAVLSLPSPCRLLASACCPDKDLVILITKPSGRDRMSLWKVQGSKKWEVNTGSDENSTQEIVGLAWSPDGQTVAVAHDPPLITIHSIQDGRKEGTLPITITDNTQNRSHKITGIWWFGGEKPATSVPVPDIFKRGNVITGSAHSILKFLPLLDPLQDDTQKSNVINLFPFQTSQNRPVPEISIPEAIKSWPTLLPDYLAASMSPPSHSRNQFKEPDAATVDKDEDNVNSILAVADESGHIHCFLDGSCSLGAIHLGLDSFTSSLFKDPKQPIFHAHLQTSAKDVIVTDLRPTFIELGLLKKRDTRDFSKLSSTARELVWYITRVVKEMRNAWFGCETCSGARELGPKWIRALEERQKEQFGQDDPNPILDLTCLLATGRASESLQDFLGSGEQMSERGVQKWESTVREALVKLRDFSEKRAAPACQRLFLVLEEIQGWSVLPQYAEFGLPAEEVDICLELAGRAIVISSWLGSIARRELSRFKEFICWLKYAITHLSHENGRPPPPPRHDILEVNNYLMSGLVVSSIDKWFMGPVPQFSSRDLGVLGGKQELSAAIERAKKVAGDAVQMKWQTGIKPNDLNHLDRNLDGLVQELTERCYRVFIRGSGAATRSAKVWYCSGPEGNQAESTRPSTSQTSQDLVVRERIIGKENETGSYRQYLAMHSSANRNLVCVVEGEYGSEGRKAIRVAVVECCVAEETQEGERLGEKVEVLDAEFFDDECMVVVVRAEEGATFIATISYNDLGYREFWVGEYVMRPTREDLMQEVMGQWKEGEVRSVRIPMKRCRRVTGCEGEVRVAVNGRVRRRIGCVLSEGGRRMECFDLEDDGEEGEGEEDAEEVTVDGEL